MKLEKDKEYRVKGYIGRWGVIDNEHGYVLLEHTTVGDGTCYLVVNEDAPVVNRKYENRETGEIITLPTIEPLEVVETYDGIEIALTDAGIL